MKNAEANEADVPESDVDHDVRVMIDTIVPLLLTLFWIAAGYLGAASSTGIQ